MIKDLFGTPVESDLKGRAIDRRYGSDLDDSGWLTVGVGDRLRRLIDNGRVAKFFVVFFVIIILLSGRLFYLQIIRGGYYKSISEGNRIRTEELKANRGLIYDRNKVLLVENVPEFYLMGTKAELPTDAADVARLSMRVGEVFGTSTQAVFDKLADKDAPYSYQPQVLAENVSERQAVIFETGPEYWQGLRLRSRGQRHYLGDLSLSHTLGYLAKISEAEWKKNEDKGYALDDYVGRTGLELQYEDILKGAKGKREAEVNSSGQEKDLIMEEPAVLGESLVLSIDEKLQEQAAAALAEGIKKAKAQKGALVAINPQNGEVLALVSYPFFDNNDFVSGISGEKYKELTDNLAQPLFFRSLSGTYPPGSTIKPLMALAGLEDGIITKNTTVNSVGGIWVDKWFFPDWKAGGHGYTDVRKAIADSVNTFFYYVGGGFEDFKGLGLDKIRKYLIGWGLTRETGIDLPSEAKGFLPTEAWKETSKGEQWYIGDTYHLSIGQGDALVTPLQVANYTAMIANDGVLYKPNLLRATIDPKTGQENYTKKEVLESLKIVPENLQTVQEGMRQTVTAGSARSLSNLPFKVAGKTGTAQAGGDAANHAWFTCYAPYEAAEIAVTVLIENGGGGDVAAVPVARKVLEAWWAEKGE